MDEESAALSLEGQRVTSLLIQAQLTECRTERGSWDFRGEILKALAGPLGSQGSLRCHIKSLSSDSRPGKADAEAAITTTS